MSRTDTPAAPSFVSGAALVAGREIRMRIRAKSFIVSTAILLLAVLGAIVAGAFFADRAAGEVSSVAAVQGLDIPAEFDVTPAADAAAAEELVRNGDVDAAVLPGDGPAGVRIIGLEGVPGEVVDAFSVIPSVDLLEPPTADGFLPYLIAFAFGLVFFMTATVFGATIASSVVEEKQSRVVEILMSAISSRVLLAGKVVGNTILAFGQIVAIAVVALLGLALTGQTALLGLVGPSVGLFVLFFVVGFVLVAALFAAGGALVSRQEDIGQVTTPVMMILIIPFYAIIFFYDNDAVLALMSYIPFSAPIAMPMRVYLGTAAWWEPVLAFGVVVATAALVVVLGARVYSNSLLRTGARVKLLDALRG